MVLLCSELEGNCLLAAPEISETKSSSLGMYAALGKLRVVTDGWTLPSALSPSFAVEKKKTA